MASRSSRQNVRGACRISPASVAGCGITFWKNRPSLTCTTCSATSGMRLPQGSFPWSNGKWNGRAWRPPVEYAWIGLGQRGKERTDLCDRIRITCSLQREHWQAIAEAPNSYYAEFAARIVERLDAVGFAKCKAESCHRMRNGEAPPADWEQKIRETLTEDKKTLELLDLIILSDAAPHLWSRAAPRNILTALLCPPEGERSCHEGAGAVCRPHADCVRFFRKVQGRRGGENKGKFNIKLHGWAPLIMSVGLWPLRKAFTTLTRSRGSGDCVKKNLIKREVEEELVDAYLLLSNSGLRTR